MDRCQHPTDSRALGPVVTRTVAPRNSSRERRAPETSGLGQLPRPRRGLQPSPLVAAMATMGQTTTSKPNARCSNSAHEWRRRPPRRPPPTCGTRGRARSRRSTCCRRDPAASNRSAASATAAADAFSPSPSPPARCRHRSASSSSSTTRHQRAQPLHQHLLRHHHRRRAVAPALLQRVPDPPIRQLHQTRLRSRRSGCVRWQSARRRRVVGDE
jgi:hypothetical protein